MLIVHIEKPDDKTLAEWFGEIRLWFDTNGCQPIKFAPAARKADKSLYRVSFESKTKADEFALLFAKEPPVPVHSTIGGRCKPTTREPTQGTLS